jgi:excisionase family DNA binding protein
LPNRFDHRYPECVTVSFIARCCQVSTTTVLRWIEGGRLLAFRLPSGHYRIGSEEFDRFLTDHNIPGSAGQRDL